MITATEVLDAVRAAGADIQVHGTKLRLVGATDALTPQLVDEVRRFRSEIWEIFGFLQLEAEQEAAEAMAEAFTPGPDWEVNPLAERMARAGGWVGLTEKFGVKVADELHALACQWIEQDPTHEAVRTAIAEHFEWTWDLAEA